ncbi:MAG TPA: zf-HC2 domain-containing protein [Actinomycetota bacterium]
MIAREMTCKELVELVTAYLDGGLGRGRRRRFEAHLAGCDGCTAHLAQIRETIRVTGGLREDQVTHEQRTALLAAFRGWSG